MTATIATSAYRKIAWRVLAVLTLLIVLSSIDRVNISFAALQMNADLGLDPKAYGFGVGLFSVGYLLFQLPSMALLKRIGARRWIAASVIGWGSCATAMAFVQVPWHFYLLRVGVGVCESGFAPGVVWYVSQWLPQAYRGRAVGATLLAIPISVIVGGPLSGALLSIGHATIAGWRFMFFVEGAATVLLGAMALVWFVDRPADARWLDAEERGWIAAAIARDRRDAGPIEQQGFAALLRDSALWLSAIVWFVLITGANGLTFWLPTAIKTLGTKGDFLIGVLTALPWIGIGAGMILNARHSDRRQERFGHIGLAMLLGAAGLALAAAAGGGAAALGALMIGGLGLGGAQGVFWTVPTRLLGTTNPQAIALINLCGNLSGVVSPIAIGWVVATTHSIAVPVYVLAALLLAGALVLLPLRRIAATRLPAEVRP